MQTMHEAASAFLDNKQWRSPGISPPREPRQQCRLPTAARARLRGLRGQRPRSRGDRSYPDLRSIPGGVEAVVIATRPEFALETMRECADLGIKHAWMHRGAGAGSVSQAATDYGRQHGITVIDGGCPLMFGPTADFGHRLIRFIYSGNVPKEV